MMQERDMDMFVDNMPQQHNGYKDDLDVEDLMRIAHHDINLWDRLMGLLANIITLERDDELIPQKRVAEDVGTQMLGAQNVLNLQEDTALAHLDNKTMAFVKTIMACPIPKYKVLVAYHIMYLPSILYIIPAITLVKIN
eukprot:7009284-Ditylum_brightwellii.AAC.1